MTAKFHRIGGRDCICRMDSGSYQLYKLAVIVSTDPTQDPSIVGWGAPLVSFLSNQSLREQKYHPSGNFNPVNRVDYDFLKVKEGTESACFERVGIKRKMTCGFW